MDNGRTPFMTVISFNLYFVFTLYERKTKYKR